ncbi:hypothetical protein H4582DRAFT_2058858 [Lactarius indigo]|nr:hypothetical protein H4582DRAFT_2058858 [Lactarius indigo]
MFSAFLRKMRSPDEAKRAGGRRALSVTPDGVGTELVQPSRFFVSTLLSFGQSGSFLEHRGQVRGIAPSTDADGNSRYEWEWARHKGTDHQSPGRVKMWGIQRGGGGWRLDPVPWKFSRDSTLTDRYAQKGLATTLKEAGRRIIPASRFFSWRKMERGCSTGARDTASGTARDVFRGGEREARTRTDGTLAELIMIIAFCSQLVPLAWRGDNYGVGASCSIIMVWKWYQYQHQTPNDRNRDDNLSILTALYTAVGQWQPLATLMMITSPNLQSRPRSIGLQALVTNGFRRPVSGDRRGYDVVPGSKQERGAWRGDMGATRLGNPRRAIAADRFISSETLGSAHTLRLGPATSTMLMLGTGLRVMPDAGPGAHCSADPTQVIPASETRVGPRGNLKLTARRYVGTEKTGEVRARHATTREGPDQILGARDLKGGGSAAYVKVYYC